MCDWQEVKMPGIGIYILVKIKYYSKQSTFNIVVRSVDL